METLNAPPTTTADPRRWKALVILAIVQFMLILDDTVVNVALPSIQSSLHFSSSGLAWVVNAYVISFGGLLLLGGRLGDFMGRRRMFMIGTTMFALASLTSGLAQESWMLIGSRILQGVGAAVVAPSAFAIVTLMFTDAKERAMALGIWGGLAGAGGTLGVVVSGALTDYANWRWVFFINLPFALIALALVPRLVDESTVDSRTAIDVSGAIAITAALFSLVYGLLEAATKSWGNPAVVISLLIAGVLFGVFITIERAKAAPLVPLGFFKHRTRATANVASLFLTSSFYAMFFSLTLFMQDVLHYSPMKAGLAYLPFGVSLIAAVAVSSNAVPRIGVRTTLAFGFGIAAIGMALYTRIDPSGGYVSTVLPGMLVMAFGMGLTFPALTLAAVDGVSDDDAGLASGIQNAVQQVGGALGLSILVTIATRHSKGLLKTGHDFASSLTQGFSFSFGVAAVVLAVGGVFAFIVTDRLAGRHQGDEALDAAEAQMLSSTPVG